MRTRHPGGRCRFHFGLGPFRGHDLRVVFGHHGITGHLLSKRRLKCFLRCQGDEELFDFPLRLSLGRGDKTLHIVRGEVRRDKTRRGEVQAAA